jgi:uncharacterized membrane protein YfcA
MSHGTGRAIVICVLAIIMGSLFITAYSLAIGDPMPHHTAAAPSGATVTALREAVYFPGYQHVRPIAVLAAWAAVLVTAMLGASLRLRESAESLAGGPSG